ncbi:MAG: HAD family hydrolase [Acidimicrobiia bacterium]|nr:HAD family hydrolase [Acidimicrobiia bacterium]
MTVTTVLFDVGETLVDETRQWEGWARWLGVPPSWFFAALGAVIERGALHTDVFAALDHPDIDVAAERERRLDAGDPDEFDERDLYPDARACLDALTRQGLTVGIAANQPAHREAVVRRLFPGVDMVLLSGALGVEKPAPEFFDRALAALSIDDPAEVAYVGDRLDNDVLPALEAGMVGVHLRRGPWGVIHAMRPEAARASVRIDGLAELADALAGLSGGRPG